MAWRQLRAPGSTVTGTCGTLDTSDTPSIRGAAVLPKATAGASNDVFTSDAAVAAATGAQPGGVAAINHLSLDKTHMLQLKHGGFDPDEDTTELVIPYIQVRVTYSEAHAGEGHVQ